VPSFDLRLAAGVATYALEFFRGTPELDTVYVPVGLGSGICGVSAARNALKLPTKIVGVVSTEAPCYARSFAARQVISHPATTRIADGIAIRQPNALALALIQQNVARFVSVTDDETEAAMRAYFTDTHNVAEGAAGAGLAAVLQKKSAHTGQRVGVVFTGGNVDQPAFARVLAG
jgi:threonine dehydratase